MPDPQATITWHDSGKGVKVGIFTKQIDICIDYVIQYAASNHVRVTADEVRRTMMDMAVHDVEMDDHWKSGAHCIIVTYQKASKNKVFAHFSISAECLPALPETQEEIHLIDLLCDADDQR